MIAPATPIIEIHGWIPGGIPEETAELVAALLLSIVDEQDAALEGGADEV
ncbi:MAG: hypothetical protein NTW96_26190 [Planctomycetia bacterium]|nr:hypothetical protein [Planctomycetia bacterium]